jgi:FkbM family methyltransferase
MISGGKIQFLDAELNFPEGVGLHYATPLFWNGPEAYETHNSRAIALLASRSQLFLDVGSNIGIFSVYAGVRHPRVTTFAFEPVPAIWKKNCAFHVANNLQKESVLNLALADSDGPRKIFIPVYQTAIEEEQTATLRADSWQTHEEKFETIEIQCLTLDSFAAANHLPDGMCSLKIDVENVEADVLRGGKNFIQARRPWIVCEILPCEEYDPATKVKRNNNRETLALVQELRYVPFAITDSGFFRMTPGDFARPREFREFLLAPEEKIPTGSFYLDPASLAEFLPPP